MVSVSAPMTTSPLCRSPLSQSSFPRRSGGVQIPDHSSPSKRDHQQQRPQQPPSDSSSDEEGADHYAHAPARRPSTTTTTTIALSPRRLSTSRSLAGSYTLSLLSSRMSAAHPTHHVPSAFTLKLSTVSPGKGVPSGLKCPEHVKIAFDARWYALDSSTSPTSTGGAAWTPWVGNVDIEEHYAKQYRIIHPPHPHSHNNDVDVVDGWTRPHSQHPATGVVRGKREAARPRPGYQLGVSGKIQLFIMQTVLPSDQQQQQQPQSSSPHSHPHSDGRLSSTPTLATTGKTTPVKVFLVDYDLTSLQPGGRLLYKERAYQTLPSATHTENQSPPPPTQGKGGEGKGTAREVLKYAIELQFLCLAKRKTGGKSPASSTMESSTSKTDKKRKRPAAATASSYPTTTSTSESGNPHSSASYYLGKQIRLVFPTNSSALHPTEGPMAVSSPTTTTTTTTTASRRYSSGAPAAPSIRIERLIEVQNPPAAAAAAAAATPPPPQAQALSQPLPASTLSATESQPVERPNIPSATAAATAADRRRESAGVSFSGSMTSESWDDLRARWNVEAGRAAAASFASAATPYDIAKPQGSKPDERQDLASGIGILGPKQQQQQHHALKSSTLKNGARPCSPNPPFTNLPPPATISSGLVFTRSPTPVLGGLSLLKSPSLLTARLEEMSGSFTGSPPPAPPIALAEEHGAEAHNTLRGGINGGVDSARASGAGRRRKAPLWPALGAGDEDHERLLSESLEKLPISYHR
ncbi:hypothetical protein QFC21_001344 [Naganishia friedmannii]|uniref:Uncharacterized protein n=1 Tax=Naganishia friedmannii TaxID=89922 RepID=A0ACC2W4Z9_9TREE|nr:hypothetical protein QFC21_001344 [Naganishia friedmannii]